MEVMEVPRGGVTVVGVTAGGAGVAVLVRLPVALVGPPVCWVRRTDAHKATSLHHAQRSVGCKYREIVTANTGPGPSSANFGVFLILRS